MYNHYMNGVDNADQLRCYYSTQRVHYKSWKPLWHFLLDTTIVNSYKIHRYTPEQHHYYSQREFRTKLTAQLFEHSERLTGLPDSVKLSLSARVHPTAARDHGRLERMGGKAKQCVVCLHAGRKVEKLAKIRKPLSELSVFTVRIPQQGKRKQPQQVPRGLFGCKLVE